jgi:hypothetical protein
MVTGWSSSLQGGGGRQRSSQSHMQCSSIPCAGMALHDHPAGPIAIVFATASCHSHGQGTCRTRTQKRQASSLGLGLGLSALHGAGRRPQAQGTQNGKLLGNTHPAPSLIFSAPRSACGHGCGRGGRCRGALWGAQAGELSMEILLRQHRGPSLPGPLFRYLLHAAGRVLAWRPFHC